MDAKVALMKRTPLFSALREETIAFLLEFTRTVEIRANEYFFREGDDAASVYILEKGSAAVIKSWEHRDVQLRILGPGECFGEMALMDMFPRSASIRAVEDCTALELSPRGMVRLYGRDLEQYTLVQISLGREVCRRLRDADERLFVAGMGIAGVDTSRVFRAT